MNEWMEIEGKKNASGKAAFARYDKLFKLQLNDYDVTLDEFQNWTKAKIESFFFSRKIWKKKKKITKGSAPESVVGNYLFIIQLLIANLI